MAVASLVLGIVGIVVTWLFPLLPIGLILGVIAIVLAVLGKKSLVAQGKKTGMATAGLVLGIISAALGGIVFAACMICYHAVDSAIESAGSLMQDAVNNSSLSESLEQALDQALDEAADSIAKASVDAANSAAEEVTKALQDLKF